MDCGGVRAGSETERVWFCGTDDAKCYECSSTECLADCTHVQNLERELPTLVRLLWGVTVLSLSTTLMRSCELGACLIALALAWDY